MEEKDFEGTLILERIVGIKKLDEFFEAIDNDDFEQAEKLMKLAGIDSTSIEITLRKMREADGEH